MQSFDKNVIAEAKRQLFAEKKNSQMQKRLAKAEKKKRNRKNRAARALAEKIATVTAAANIAINTAEEARLKTLKIAGVKATIKKIANDIDKESHTYNTVMAYREALPLEQRHTMDGLLLMIHENYKYYIMMHTNRLSELEELTTPA
jgi:phage protein D